MQSTLEVFHVFADERGQHGNPVGIVLDQDDRIAGVECQQAAAKHGFSEIVCVKDLTARRVRIFTSRQEVQFAGHAIVGTCHFLQHMLGTPISHILCAEVPVTCWSESDVIWVRADLRITPPWWQEKLSTWEEVDALDGPQSENQDHVQVWAWIDEAQGHVRARTFAPAWGIAEDEANGSGCMRLAAALGRSLIVRHGAGSVVYARPCYPGSAEVGGRVVRKAALTFG